MMLKTHGSGWVWAGSQGPKAHSRIFSHSGLPEVTFLILVQIDTWCMSKAAWNVTDQ
jgi:hypothetical protein